MAARAAASIAAAVLLWNASVQDALGGYYHRRLGADRRTVADVLDLLVAPGDQVVATLGAEYPLRYDWRHDVEGLDVASPREPPPGGARVWIVTLAGWDDSARLARRLGGRLLPRGGS